MKRLWIEFQRWNNSRALVCDYGCDFRPVRTRDDLAWFKASLHMGDFPGHIVRVSRRG